MKFDLCVAAATVGLLTAMPIRAEVAPLVVPRGMALKLMVIDEVTTKTAKPGDRIKLRLHEAVTIDGVVAIKAGVPGVGEVVSSAESGIAGRSGKLSTRLLHLEIDGTRLMIDGAPKTAGKGGNTQIILATLALTPWGPFARGNNAKLKAGEIVNAVTAADYPVPSTSRGTVPVSLSAAPRPESDGLVMK